MTETLALGIGAPVSQSKTYPSTWTNGGPDGVDVAGGVAVFVAVPVGVGVGGTKIAPRPQTS